VGNLHATSNCPGLPERGERVSLWLSTRATMQSLRFGRCADPGGIPSPHPPTRLERFATIAVSEATDGIAVAPGRTEGMSGPRGLKRPKNGKEEATEAVPAPSLRGVVRRSVAGRLADAIDPSCLAVVPSPR
jgi:hypothetical protein